MEKDGESGVTNTRGLACLTLGLICLVGFHFLLDHSALSTGLDQESSGYMRQLLVLFILPLVLFVLLVRYYRTKIAEFWFRWGVPFSVSAIMLIWLLPPVLVSLAQYVGANSEAVISTEHNHDLDDDSSRARNEGGASEPETFASVDATIAIQQDVDNSDKKFYWLMFSVGIALTVIGAMLYRLPKPKLSTVSSEEPAPIAQVVQSSSRINITSTQHYADVVTLTFRRLVKLAGQKAGVTLGQGVTASEFQSALQKQGFPKAELQVITHAFEQVRYGHHEPSREQISQVELAIATIHGYLNMDGEHNE